MVVVAAGAAAERGLGEEDQEEGGKGLMATLPLEWSTLCLGITHFKGVGVGLWRRASKSWRGVGCVQG